MGAAVKKHLGISNSELSSDLIVRFSSSLTQGRCGAQDAKRWEGQEKQSNYKRCNTRHKSGKPHSSAVRGNETKQLGQNGKREGVNGGEIFPPLLGPNWL
ncbi:hypothetical protein RRG08_064843 [Elysia crispata]|uniref:Uncharacterized protein n=1 Tax=Elysia crispata TaxID=231223 RepID=A0AAE1E3W8_9GAST|nr:hypothetical protein RRG08_064843 [Elysia crispata]